MKYFSSLILLLSICTHADAQLFDSLKSLSDKLKSSINKPKDEKSEAVFTNTKLPTCPSVDKSKNMHFGIGGRTEQWHNCYGRYSFELKDYLKGEVYEGEFQNGFPNGNGTYTFTNGAKYVGEFKNGRQDGQGTYTYIDGGIYTGEFKDGSRHGLGTHVYANGDKFVGEFKNGLPITFGSNAGKLIPAEKLTTSSAQIKSDAVINAEKSVQVNLPPCPQPDLSKNEERITSGEYSPGQRIAKWHNCYGKYITSKNNFIGNSSVYEGEFQNGHLHGIGKKIRYDGYVQEGIWDTGVLIRPQKFKQSEIETKEAAPSDKTNRDQLEIERRQLAEERRRLDAEKQQREQAKASQRLTLQVSNSVPDNEGDFTINISTNTDTASLKINGVEQGGKADGNYSIKRVARAGQTSTFSVIAKDVFGNTDTKTLSVSRAIADSSNKYTALNPALIKNRTSTDAVAIIIGIQNYRRIPKADFASDDANDFYDYAIRAFGIKPENIKLLIDDQADDVEILATFQSWLPVKVRKQKSDVYIFYSGHGLPSEDGKNLYFLPYGTDKQYLERTALNQQTLLSMIQAAQPKSVTMFIDACYSGQSRTGETLLASARPISLKQSASSFPPEFTVFSASAPDQLSSSSPELKHGVFSYYLMRGMEGDADENRDGKITNTEMQNYLRDMVSRQALTLNRKQEPQLIGDAGKVLVGR
jgi:hypothetical protein